MEEALLASVEGGYSSVDCIKDFGKGVAAGLVTGVFSAGPAGIIPGYLIGVGAGTAWCTGNAIG